MIVGVCDYYIFIIYKKYSNFSTLLFLYLKHYFLLLFYCIKYINKLFKENNIANSVDVSALTALLQMARTNQTVRHARSTENKCSI